MTRGLFVCAMVFSEPAWAGMSLSVDAMTVDGLELRKFECEVEKGGFLASAEIAAAPAKQKPAFDACAPAGAAFQVAWTFTDGPATVVSVSQTTASHANKCIEQALFGARSTAHSTCAAVILTGDATAARAAADTLPSVE